MEEKRIPAQFYKNENGTEPVRDWLKDLDKEDRKLIGADIKTVEIGWPIGMPTCRPMGKGLFEVRTNLPQGRKAGVLFCIYDEKMILLNGFIKKTQKTPQKELELALERKQKPEAQR
ncbi:type II toxin-antitoxin system RelE/ParE family toxin [Nostoc favosum]|uniref:Type II toxin-antitoxin system RelE/ParE family toxin n=1 Tax=Nostoc favosum CHAB5714 TaxID=2780399 RepID=A0ABS8I1C6_9NOSO|nr:type II toxin-antitoxin system RelE/ParE family toxin [Nostoc favosum]MCC5597756.1 type II toxin-antitoxin system RelE/ParE family toxin [Nostoc favosum CHAB5714]